MLTTQIFVRILIIDNGLLVLRGIEWNIIFYCYIVHGTAQEKMFIKPACLLDVLTTKKSGNYCLSLNLVLKVSLNNAWLIRLSSVAIKRIMYHCIINTIKNRIGTNGWMEQDQQLFRNQNICHSFTLNKHKKVTHSSPNILDTKMDMKVTPEPEQYNFCELFYCQNNHPFFKWLLIHI